MTLHRPHAVVTIAGRSLTSAEGAVVQLRVSRGFGAHDAAELLLWPRSKFASAARGAVMSVALGDPDDERVVWTGEVAGVEAGADGVVIDGVASTASLTRRRVTQTYLDQSVESIVRDLAGDADVDEVSGDVELPAYSVDARRPVWAHLLDLAALVGADVGTSAEGGLRFVPPRTGSADVRLRYGADVLAWRLGAAPAVASASAVAYGAASEAGAEQWHWLLREPPVDAATPTRSAGALRTRDAADALADALAARAERAAKAGRLRLTAHPEIDPGDLIEIADLPGDDPGTLRALAVEHVLDGRAGLVTTVRVEGAT